MHRAFWPNVAWWLAQTESHRRFRRALDHPAATQERVLRRILRQNAATAFGRRHDFARLRAIRDYQELVPLTQYDAFQPWIDRIRDGEPGVLTREPVRRLVPTSGSTAAAKLIPWTDTLQREFSAGIGPWIFDLLRRDPGLLAGPAYWSVTPAGTGPTIDSAVPVGFAEDTAYLGAFWKPLVDRTMAVPAGISGVTDMEEFWRQTIDALLRACELRLISVWHPSFLSLLMARIGRPYREVWPRLRLISCWADGPAALALEPLRRAFPEVTIQPKGLLATEAFVSLPFRGQHPLAVRSHFFEFLDSDGRARLVPEIEPGGEYSIVVTTGGGLYRYRLGDRVRVTGLLGNTPSLEFLGKEDGVADRFGEKLSEGFVALALRRLFDAFQMHPRFALLAPEPFDGATAYTLFVENEGVLPAALAAALETELSTNPQYAHCVRLGQLAPARVFGIAGGGFRAYADHLQSQGQPLGRIKPRMLSPDGGWAAIFQTR